MILKKIKNSINKKCNAYKAYQRYVFKKILGSEEDNDDDFLEKMTY